MKESSPNDPPAVLYSVMIGSASGFFSSFLLQPLDRLKTLSQQHAVRQTNAFRGAKEVVCSHGLFDLWRGTTPTLLRVVPGVALYFGFFELGRPLAVNASNTHLANFILGSSSRALAASLLMPTTVIKARFESSVYRDASVFDAIKSVVRLCGFSGLYKGMVPTLLRDAPFSGLYLVFYRQHLKMFKKSEQEYAPAVRFTCGVLAGFFACAVTQPFDIVKTHMQLYPKKFSSLAHVVYYLYEEGGIFAFFNGFILRACRRTLMAALNWTIFDELFGLRYRRTQTRSSV